MYRIAFEVRDGEATSHLFRIWARGWGDLWGEKSGMGSNIAERPQLLNNDAAELPLMQPLEAHPRNLRAHPPIYAKGLQPRPRS